MDGSDFRQRMLSIDSRFRLVNMEHAVVDDGCFFSGEDGASEFV